MLTKVGPNAVLATLLMLTLVAWVSSAFTDQWTADDLEVVLQNPVINGAADASAAFSRDYTEHLGASGQWRPLSAISLRLDHALFGPSSSAPWHGTNILIHLLTVTAAWLLSRRIHPGGFALGILFFSLHPILSNSVAWVSGRPAMLCVLLGLTAANLHGWVLSKRVKPSLQAASACVAATLPLLAKEDGVLFTLLLFYLAVKAEAGARLANILGILLAVCAWLLTRELALGALSFGAHPALVDASTYERAIVGVRAFAETIRISVIPYGFSPRYELAALPTTAFAVSLVSLCAYVAVHCIRRRGWSPILFLAPALAFTPFLQVIPAGEIYAPRFAHIALLFSIPLADRALSAAPSKLAIVMLASLIAGSWTATRHYCSAESYWTAALMANPQSAVSLNALGLVHQDQGDHEAALGFFKRSLTADPSHSRAWTNKARSLYAMGKTDEATPALRQAVKTGPKNPIAHVNWGRHLQRVGEHGAAKQAYERATELSPGMHAAWTGLADACQALGEHRAASDARLRAEDISPMGASKP